MSLIVNNSTVKLNVVSDRMINGAPAGGTTNQLLAKNSNADYDFKYVSAGSGSGVVVEVVAGTNVTVDNTDPAFPIVSASGGGAVASVNGETGAVVLDYADVGAAQALGTNDNYVTDAEKIVIGNTSGTNTGDQNLSGKQDTLVNQVNIKSINGTTLLGSGDLTVGGSVSGDISIDTVQYAAAPSVPAAATGLTYYDAANHTLSTVLENGVTLQHGQELHRYVKNTSGVIIPDGRAVSTTHVGGSFTTAALTDITNETSSLAFIGVSTQAIAINAFGYITISGSVNDLDTSLLTEGAPLFVTTSGTLTNSLPSAPNYILYVGVTEYAHASNGRICVNPVITPKLENLSDVNGTALSTSGLVPVWDNVNKYFDFTKNISNVDNTSDVNKPVSTAQQTALNGKQIFHGMRLKPVAAVPTHLTSTTFTLGATANPCSYYYQGVLVSVASNKTTTLSGAAGKYYIFFDAATGNLSNSTSFPGVFTTSNVLVASVIWNGTDYGVVNYEMHGHDRNHSWHYWAHLNIGTLYTSGITLTHNSGTGAAATFATTAGEIADEDINFTVGASSGFPTANACRVLYQTGAGVYGFDVAPSTVPFKLGTGNLATFINAATYALTTLPSATNRYINVFFYVTTDRHTPIYCLVETAASGFTGYTSTANARAVPFPNLANTNLSAEMKPIYRLVIRADGRVEPMIAADDYRIVASVPQGAGIAGTTASAVSFTPSGTIAAATVQTALEEMDTEKQATLVSATNIKTINGSSILGSGDLTVSAAAMVTDMTLIGAGTAASPLKRTDFTDFMSATTTAHAPWTGAALSSGTSAAVDGTAEHPGMVTMRGFTSANGGYRYHTTNNSMVIKGGEHFELVFYTNVLSAARIRFGYFDTNTAVDAVNGAFINIDTTTLTGQNSAASTRTSTASSYTLSLTTYYRGVIDINTAKTLVTFTLYAENGTQLWQDTLNTNIPTAVLGHGVMGWDTSTANNIMVRLDAMAQGQTGVFVR